MKGIAIAAVLLFAGSAAAQNQTGGPFDTGNGYLYRCETAFSGTSWYSPCAYYVMGIHDSVNMMMDMRILQRLYCAPHGVTYEQLKDMLVAHVRQNASTRHQPTPSNYLDMMVSRFPCPK